MRYWILFLVFGVVLTEGNRRSEYDTLLAQALSHLGVKDVQQPFTVDERNPIQSDFHVKVKSTNDGNKPGEIAVESTEEKNFTPYYVEESQGESYFPKDQSSIRERNQFDSEDQPLFLLTGSGELVLVPENVQVPEVPFMSTVEEPVIRQSSAFGTDIYEKEEVMSDTPSVKKLIEDLVKKINEAAPTITVGESLQRFLLPGFCKPTGPPDTAESSPDSSIGNPLPGKIPIGAALPDEIPMDVSPPVESPIDTPSSDVIPTEISDVASTPVEVSPVRIKPHLPILEVDSQLTKLVAEYYKKQKQKQQLKQLLLQRAINSQGFLNNLPGTGSDTGRPTLGVVPISYLHGLINGDQILINQLLRASELGGLANVPPGLMIVENSQNEFLLPEGMKLVSQIENRPIPISLFDLTNGFPSSFVRIDKKDSNTAIVHTQEQPTATVDELLEVIKSLRLHSSIEKKLEKYFTNENRKDLSGADRYNLIRYVENLEKENEYLDPENTRRHFDETNLKADLRNLNLSRRVAGELAEALSRRFGLKGSGRKRPSIPLFGGGEGGKANNREMRDFNMNLANEKLREDESDEKRTRNPRQNPGNVKIVGFNNFISKFFIKRKLFNPTLFEIQLDFKPLSMQHVRVEEGTPAVAEFLLQIKFDLITQGLFLPSANLMEFNVKMVTPDDVMLPACLNLSETELQGLVDEIVKTLNASDLPQLLRSILIDLLNSGSNLNLYRELSSLIIPGFKFP